MDIFTNTYIEQYGLINTFTQQNYILSYLHPDNPYRSLIICYEVGLGKTYASACLSQFYLMAGYKVLYLSNSLNSISNFVFEYNKMINDSRLIDFKYNIDSMTFSKFYKRKFDDVYGLIILDEVHNLRENAIRYSCVKSSLDKLVGSKILIISATPMVDSVDELDSIKKLTGEENPKILFSYNQLYKDIRIDYIGEKVNNEILFVSIMKGKQLQEYYKSLNKNNNAVYTSTRQASISYSNKYDPNIPLSEQSSKISRLMNNLCDNKPTVIFCFYIERGIDFLSDVLEHNGYVRYNSNSILTKNTKKYAIIDGRCSSIENEIILDTFNNITNSRGELIHILIGSSVLSESITLYRVRELHILSPFWNYGQVEQSIGRAIRIGSHQGSEESQISIYLHAACTDNNYNSKDIDMWKIAYEKKEKINSRLDKERDDNKINYNLAFTDFYVPEVDNKLVFKVNDWIWDLRECFDKNKYKISWCKVKYENTVGYDTNKKVKVIGAIPNGINIHVPIEGGYTIWRSCIDDKLRISYIGNKVNKFSKRGKIITNMKSDEIKLISKDLGCENNLNSIIDKLKSINRYFDKQIDYDL